MLGKILKYDFKSIGKSLFPLYFLLLISALISRFTNFLGNSITFFKIIYKLSMIIFVILIVGALFYTLFVSVKRYYKNLFSDEGYLTNTLPVSSTNLAISKVITSIFYFLVTIGIMILSLMIVVDIDSLIKNTNDLIIYAATYLKISKELFVVFIITLVSVMYIYYLILIFAGISIGQSHSNNKVLFSIIWSIVLYYFGQVISTISLGIMSFFDSDFAAAMTNNIPDSSLFKQLFIFIIIVNFISIVIFYLIIKNRFKHLNLQ